MVLTEAAENSSKSFNPNPYPSGTESDKPLPPV